MRVPQTELFQHGLLEATIFPASSSKGSLSAAQKTPLPPTPFPAASYSSGKPSLTPWWSFGSPPISTPDTALKARLFPATRGLHGICPSALNLKLPGGLGIYLVHYASLAPAQHIMGFP